MDTVQMMSQEDEILLIGVLTFETSAQALGLLTQYLKKQGTTKSQQDKNNPIILNLSGISKSDSSALALLMGFIRMTNNGHLKLKIKNISQKLLNLARLSGVEGMFPLD